MGGSEGGSLAGHFSDLADPRRAREWWHQLLDIVAMTPYAVVRWTKDWNDVDLFVVLRKHRTSKASIKGRPQIGRLEQ